MFFRKHRDKTTEDLRKEYNRDLKEKLNEILNYTIQGYLVTPFKHWKRTESLEVKDYLECQIFFKNYHEFLYQVYDSLIHCFKLVEQGADPDTCSSDGKTIMHYLAAALSKAGNDNIKRDFYVNALYLCKYNYSADINKKTSFLFGSTPLEYFLHGINNPYPYNVPAVQMFSLLDIGANPYTKDIYHRELTHYVKDEKVFIEKLRDLRTTPQQSSKLTK